MAVDALRRRILIADMMFIIAGIAVGLWPLRLHRAGEDIDTVGSRWPLDQWATWVLAIYAVLLGVAMAGDETDWGKAAFHRRWGKPVRIVDNACMIGEHDDYHLARVCESIKVKKT